MTMCPPNKRMKNKSGEGKRKESQSGKGVSNKWWDKEHDDILIPFLANQARQGMKVHKTFKRTAFTAAALEINKVFGKNFTTDNVINHMKSLKARYLDMCKCLEISGAGWDEENQMITLDPASYDKESHANSKILQYVNKPLRHFEDLKTIIGDDLAMGSFRKIVYDEFGVSSAFEELPDDPLTSSHPMYDVDSPSLEAAHHSPTSTESTKHTKDVDTSRNKRGSKKGKSSKNLDDAFFDSLIERVDKMTSVIEESAPCHWTQSLSKCVYSHIDFSEDVLDKAIAFLIRDETEGRIFLATGTSGQKKWLSQFRDRLFPC